MSSRCPAKVHPPQSPIFTAGLGHRLVPAFVPRAPCRAFLSQGEEDCDLILGVLCVTSEQRDVGLGSPAEVVQRHCSREDGGQETPCTVKPYSEEGLVV